MRRLYGKLIRTRVDRFAIGDSLRLSEVEALAKAGQIEDRIVPVDVMFEDCPAYVSESEVLDKLLQNGNPFPKGLGPRDGCLVQIGSSLAEHRFLRMETQRWYFRFWNHPRL